MAPELVIADAPFKRYPGGVIALRCVDWMGAARGSLSSESDALASTGQVVRDAQQVTPATNAELEEGDVANADDTLTIPVDDIGLVEGAWYRLWVTYKLDGEWDVTNGALLRNCTQWRFAHVAALTLHGTTDWPLAFPYVEPILLGHLPAYSIAQLFISGQEPGDVLHFRAFSHVGTSVEVLLDQIVFLRLGDVIGEDREIDGTLADGVITTLVDGADGGDANGKFTFQKASGVIDAMSDLGAADYQTSDSEYNLQLIAADGLILERDSEAGSAVGYSLHVARHQPIVVEDDYDNRTTTTNSQDMGVSEGGYGYRIGATGQATPPAAFVSGGVGILRIRQAGGAIQVDFGSDSTGAPPGFNNQGAVLASAGGVIFSGVVQHTAGVLPSAGHWEFHIGDVPGVLRYVIRVDPTAKTWQLGWSAPSGFTALGSAHDISSWYSAGSLVGFKIELKRYILRARVWDAGGAEPSTWDDELFRPVRVGSTNYDYPYGDDVGIAQGAYAALHSGGVLIRTGSFLGATLPYDLTLHSLRFEHDPYGDAADMSAYMEQPEGGASLGTQVVPYGCPHFVYWGSRIWTQPNGGFERLTFASKVWNDPAAAELQRAEVTHYYFFIPEPGGIVSMNWRSSDRRNSADRVLVGDR